MTDPNPGASAATAVPAAPVVPLPAAITGPRLIALLDPPPTGDEADAASGARKRLQLLVTVLEVMVQEGVRTFALDLADAGALSQLRELFVDRASFGLAGVRTAVELDTALLAEPAFVLADTDDAEVVQRGWAAGVCTLPAGLTPNELRRLAALGAAAVQVLPADLLGGNYPSVLQGMRLGPDGEPLTVIARGGLGAWSAGRWFEAGAAAVVADTGLVGDAMTGGPLSFLRDRCHSYLDVVPTPADDQAN